MSKLEDLKPNVALRGILPDSLVTVVSVQWFGSEALELTYKDPGGRPASWPTPRFLVPGTTNQVPGLLGLAAIETELTALLDGRKVDLRTAQDLSRHFRAEVVRSAEVQYAA